MSVLEVHNVSIRYMIGDFKEIGLKEYVMRRLTGNYHVTTFWADRDITFSLEAGEMLGIIGSNGAGKSTLLKVVSGIMEPSAGYVKRKGSIAALLELGSGFDGDLTVRENTHLRGAMLGYTRKFMADTYDQIIEFAELKDFQDRPFKQLSSGMKSRLAFSIASLVRPDILILDEVLSVGDGAFRKKSEAKMREIINSGATTILVSHSLSQVQELCTKVLWLERGRQIAFGDTAILCGLYQQYLDKTITLEQAREKWACLDRHYDYLVVGGGLSGSVFAREMTDRSKSCLVIDERQQLGGNVACEDVNGITVHRFGPHIFHTDDETVWSYVNRFAHFLPYDGGFREKYQGIPSGGYNGLIEGLLKGIPTVTGMSYQKLIKAFPNIADKVFYTGSIDEFFEYSLGRLEYDSRRYVLEGLETEHYQEQAITDVENDPENCIRIIEYKHFPGEKGKGTVIAKEYPQEWLPGRIPCVPVGGERNEKLYRQYVELGKEYPAVIFSGRLGEYKNYSMAEAIVSARELSARELSARELEALQAENTERQTGEILYGTENPVQRIREPRSVVLEKPDTTPAKKGKKYTMVQKIKKLIIPLITIVAVSVFPAIVMYCQNADEAGFSEIAPVLLAYMTVGIGLLLMLGFLTRSAAGAVIPSVIMVLIITNFAVIEAVLKRMIPGLKYWHTVPIILVVGLHLAYLICKLIPQDIVEDVVTVLCLVFSLLIGFNFVTSAPKIVRHIEAQRQIRTEQQQQKEERIAAASNQPNVYFLMFDEYANFPQIEEYGFKNEELKNFLIENHFTISYTSHNDSIMSSTIQTNIANLDYIVDNNTSESEKTLLRKQGLLFSLMREHGYDVQIIENEDNFGGSNPVADTNGSGAATINGENLTDICVQQTIAYPFWTVETSGKVEIVTGISNYLSEPNNLPDGNTFTLVYFNFPHQPFLVDENGAAIQSSHNRDWENDQYYLGQFKYATKLMIQMLDNIVQYDPTAVIIVQSDHGARSTTNKDLFLEGKFSYELASNFFNVVYYQGEAMPEIEGQSAVNTLRIVLNFLWDTDMELLQVPKDTYKYAK